MSEETIIGPNPCHWCGGEYGEHRDTCKRKRVEPQEVTLMDVILDIEKLRGEIFGLKMRVKDLEQKHENAHGKH